MGRRLEARRRSTLRSRDHGRLQHHQDRLRHQGCDQGEAGELGSHFAQASQRGESSDADPALASELLLDDLSCISYTAHTLRFLNRTSFARVPHGSSGHGQLRHHQDRLKAWQGYQPADEKARAALRTPAPTYQSMLYIRALDLSKTTKAAPCKAAQSPRSKLVRSFEKLQRAAIRTLTVAHTR